MKEDMWVIAVIPVQRGESAATAVNRMVAENREILCTVRSVQPLIHSAVQRVLNEGLDDMKKKLSDISVVKRLLEE